MCTPEELKVCEETLSAHTARLAELKQLVSGIAAAVGLDGNALLGGEVEALGRRLQDVRESLTVLADVAETRAQVKAEATKEITSTRAYLDSVQKNLCSIDAEDDSETKLQSLRDQLLALSNTEGQIQSIKDKSLRAYQVTRNETSVIEILELWQQVFRETFQQYHRLSTRLVKNEDGAAALKLWQEYLVHVQQFLSGSIPGDFHSLSEHQQLCQVHQNLLTTQQNVLRPLDKRDSKLAGDLVEVSVMEQFNSLTNLHNETLARIIDRHTEVEMRLAAWKRYRCDQSNILSWLKDMEKERERLQLKYIHVRRISKVLSRIQGLIGRVPLGQNQSDNLQKQQNVLLEFCDDALATSIRMEHVAINQRISNLQAGLETWKQFLERITNNYQSYEANVDKVQKAFDGILDVITQEVPNSSFGVNNRLENLQRTRGRLNNLTKDLEELDVTKEQLKECISPVDMKTINQRMWLLWHQQSDLDHQLSVLIHQLEEKLGLRSMFETRQSRFITWTTEMEKRIDQETESYGPEKDPTEILHKLETELQAELSLKEREYNWLITTGKELVAACGDEYSDVVAKRNIQVRTEEVQTVWERLKELGASRASKIHEMIKTMSQLELRIEEIRAWLTQMEKDLAMAITFEDTTKHEIELKLQEHDKLKKSIEKQTGDIADVLNLCDLLLIDSDVWKAHFTTDSITTAIQNLEKRWKNVCGQSEERKRNIQYIWQLLQEVLVLSEEQEQWLLQQEKKMKELDRSLDKLTMDQVKDRMSKLEKLSAVVRANNGGSFKRLGDTYSKLAKANNLEPKNIQRHTSKVRTILDRWSALRSQCDDLMGRLQKEISFYQEFVAVHENAVIGLNKVDAHLTKFQHLDIDPNQTADQRLTQLQNIESELASHSKTLEDADRLGLLIMQKSQKADIAKVQEMIDEYQLLWKDIQGRITMLKSDLANQVKQQSDRLRREVDESVQVDTLAFERESAVQVNTLPGSLQRMTSISAKDAYLMELISGLNECASNIEKLEEMVGSDIPEQGSPELHTTGKKIANQTATCQSSVELIRHLCDTLVKECNATPEEAKAEEMQQLSDKFDRLLKAAKAKELKIRELRSSFDAYNFLCEHEAGRLLCPLCTKRNWAQLENDLWRLEQWLQVAEGTQKGQRSPPSNIEQLEDVIQDHREFLLDLDSHKSIVRSLNIVGTHLADHTEDTSRAVKLRARLEADNKRWDLVCKNATTWETQLQRALMDNRQFHNIVTELCSWLEKTEQKIRASEPIDLTVDMDTINNKYIKFTELRAELERCEPRVMSLQEAANQLLRRDEAPEGSSTMCDRLTDLRLKLQSLIRLTSIYIRKLGAVLGKDPNELMQTTASAVGAAPLHNLSYDLLDQPSAAPGPSNAPDNDANTGSSDDREINTTVLRKGYRFLGRVIRASLPIQALMLLLLGAASLVPLGEDDYNCSLLNSFTNNMQPSYRYNGPPPPL